MTTEQLHLAEEDPNRGWQAYSSLHPTGNPAKVVRDPVFITKNSRNLEAKHGEAAGKAMDPSTTALKVGGATRVDPGEFRTSGENASLLRPLAGRGFQVWDLPERQARDGKVRHSWRLGARLRPSVTGLYARRVFDLDATPPGIRIAGFGEVMEILRSPGQAGYRPVVSTDA